MEDFDADALTNTTIAIFMMATYTEGELTDTAALFAKRLKSEYGSLSKEYLSNLCYSVFCFVRFLELQSMCFPNVVGCDLSVYVWMSLHLNLLMSDTYH
jgi:hypothetical protein